MPFPAELAELLDAMAARLNELRAEPPPLMTVPQVARWLQVDEDYVYEHAEELGVIRLGRGPKSPLRFDREHVERVLSCSPRRMSSSPEPAPRATSRRRRPLPLGTGADLLPIRGGDRV